MTEARYEAADFFLLRAPALPVQVFQDLLSTEQHSSPAEQREQAHARLHTLAGQPEVRRALYVASSDLVNALDRPAGSPPTAKKARRLRSRLFRYLVRMATRPTPFGAFSGVALGEFGQDTTACLARPVLRNNRIRADMGWLFELIEQVENDEEIRRELQVVLNSSVHRSGDRLVLPYADVYGRGDNRAVRVRATTAALAATRLATTPIPYGQLVEDLTQLFPDADRAKVVGLIDELRELHILTSHLRPPLTVAHPETFVAKQLSGVAAAAQTEAGLRVVAERAVRAAEQEGVAPLAELTAAQRALVPKHSGPTFQLDATLNLAQSRLSAEVGTAVAEAVDCLMRLAAALPGHNHHLAQYREAFTERYGLLQLVPVLELLSPERGLDAPPTYTQPPREYPLAHHLPDPSYAEYDQALIEFAQQAWWSGAQEVALTDEWLDRLAPGHQDQRQALYPTMDAFVQLQTAGPVDTGNWRAVLRYDGLAFGGRASGRFFDLLGEEAVERLRGYARQEEALSPEVVHAELSFLPTQGRAANVAFRPLLRHYEIPVNTAATLAPDQVISLTDLYVGATDDRLFLWSKRLGKQVVVSQTNMLSPLLAPNVARFLLEVSNDGYVMPCGFRWNVLDSMPFLPRVTRGKVVLRPAQWSVNSLPGKDFASEVQAMRKRWRIPRHVYLVDNDNRLLLDLEHPVCLDELAAELDRGRGPVTLHEMLPGFGEQWLRDTDGATYLEEIVVPLLARGSAGTSRSPITVAVSQDETAAPVAYLPGSQWSFLKVYTGINQQDEIIATELSELVKLLGEQRLIDRWFYIRYLDPRPHLRLRFRAACSEAEPLLLWQLSQWGGRLAGQGLAVETALAGYFPETNRYGGPLVYDTVEKVFAANSEVTANLVALLHRSSKEIRPEFTALAALDTLYRQWGLGRRERLESLPTGDSADPEAVRAEFQQNRAYLTELLTPWDFRPHEQGRAHHDLLQEILAPQQETVAAAAAEVRAARGRNLLSGSESSVLGSLAHMQVNRLLSIDLLREAHLYALWRHTLRAIGGRPGTGGRG
ncbi:lantibiotic dehydratase [Crossiella sp. SN42]|uniref:lantibiotic dehydratase n=1 Tax=Crossiella sp. SN42 TaxID=2944808 RepID=UPI00207D6160|nr:lantibiotic dehydratase [Crossiella sp. SN42]MCO1575629.1 lantibiotic dehydratase [Crossiella sp. SN42]